MTLSRRRFLEVSGVLVVAFGSGSSFTSLVAGQGAFDTHASHIDPDQLDSWIAIGSDGKITAYTGKCDFGQGMFTAQVQLIAEEMCASIDQVDLIQCDTAFSPDQGTTSGSQSTPTNFNLENLALAAATARETLLAMASKQVGEPAEAFTITEGIINSRSGRKITFAELIGGKRFDVPLNQTAKRRSQSTWKILGKPVPSRDRLALVTARFEFVHNVRIAGMLHGRVIRPPGIGAVLSDIDEDSVRQVPGYVKTVIKKNFVGIVAEKQWQAIQAARLLKLSWKSGAELPPSNQFYQWLSKQPSETEIVVESDDIDQHFSSTVKKLSARYVYPYQMHASLGTSCAVADVKDDRATVWSATQSVYPTRSCLSKILGLPLESVRVIYTRGSGCYGLNGADTVSFDAALMSQSVGRPVRVQLSRQDEMAWDNYGAACVIDQQAAIENGNIAAWSCESWQASRGGRPGYDHPGNVVTGMLLGYEPNEVKPNPIPKRAKEFRNGDNSVPSYFAGCNNGKCEGTGSLSGERVLVHRVRSPFFTGPLRSPIRLQNTFAHESFMDEIAASLKVDPVALRLKYLREPRMIEVLKVATERAAWKARPSERKEPENGQTAAYGRGVACVAYEGDNGFAALVADIRISKTEGRVVPVRFTVAIDSGPVSNTDGLRNQTEGGILQGLSRALCERVTWDSRKITSTDWESYHSLYLDVEPPKIDVFIVNRSDGPATGAGETAITLVAGAIGNAIYDAIGIRLREVPFTADRIKAAVFSSASANQMV